MRDLDAFADGNADCCLTKPPTAEVLAPTLAPTVAPTLAPTVALTRRGGQV